MPARRNCSRNRGRIGWARRRPCTLPSGPIPFFWKVKISCMLMTFSSMPVISVMLMTLRLPSLMRVNCTTMVMRRAICWRTVFSGRFRLLIATIDSRRIKASRGVLA